MKKIYGLINNYKFLLLLFILLFNIFVSGNLKVNAYETVVMEFPYSTWKPILYKKNSSSGSIVQFIKKAESKDNYSESVIFHSYRNTSANSRFLIQSLLKKSFRQSKIENIKPRYLKLDPDDSIALWCSDSSDINSIKQCEIIRSTKALTKGVITIRYISKNPSHFKRVQNIWLDAIVNTKLYYSYYRWERVMNKAVTFEL